MRLKFPQIYDFSVTEDIKGCVGPHSEIQRIRGGTLKRRFGASKLTEKRLGTPVAAKKK